MWSYFVVQQFLGFCSSPATAYRFSYPGITNGYKEWLVPFFYFGAIEI